MLQGCIYISSRLYDFNCYKDVSTPVLDCATLFVVFKSCHELTLFNQYYVTYIYNKEISNILHCIAYPTRAQLSSPPVFSVTRSLVLCVCFVDRCLSFYTFSFGHCVVCSSSIYRFWLPPFGIFWPLCCLFLFDIQILITSLWYLLAIVLSVPLRYTDFDYLPLVSSTSYYIISNL